MGSVREGNGGKEGERWEGRRQYVIRMGDEGEEMEGKGRGTDWSRGEVKGTGGKRRGRNGTGSGWEEWKGKGGEGR